VKKTGVLFILTILLSLVLFFSGCRDTCNKKMGETFNDIRWSNFTYSPGLDKYVEGFSISVIDALPVEYLRTASQEPTDNAHIDSIAFPDVNQMNLYLHKSILPLKNSDVQIQFKMRMDDRRDFTNCVHPGETYKYDITVYFTIHNIDDVYTINNISWGESLIKGSI
jgi:hypothetical protein